MSLAKPRDEDRHWLHAEWIGWQWDSRQRVEDDPGLPAYPWHVDGTTAPFPLSYVAICRDRLPVVLNLDALRTSVLNALAGKPDTRTHAQRRADDWKAYLAAKEKYGAKDPEEG